MSKATDSGGDGGGGGGGGGQTAERTTIGVGAEQLLLLHYCTATVTATAVVQVDGLAGLTAVNRTDRRTEGGYLCPELL